MALKDKSPWLINYTSEVTLQTRDKIEYITDVALCMRQRAVRPLAMEAPGHSSWLDSPNKKNKKKLLGFSRTIQVGHWNKLKLLINHSDSRGNLCRQTVSKSLCHLTLRVFWDLSQGTTSCPSGNSRVYWGGKQPKFSVKYRYKKTSLWFLSTFVKYRIQILHFKHHSTFIRGYIMMFKT